MKKMYVPIKGMHCRSCELVLEESIVHVQGVMAVDINYSRGQAEIHYLHHPPQARSIEEAIKSAGYEVGVTARGSWLSRNPHDYRELGIAALIVLALYFGARSLGLFDISLNTQNVSLPFALVVGLVAGVSTCMAIVGGLILGISARHAEMNPEASASKKFRPHLYFNLGRILGYGFLGGLLGAIGGVLKLSNVVLALLTLAVGLLMIFLGLKLTGISPRLKESSLTLPSAIGRWFGLSRQQSGYSHRSSLITGALTFFLPCGFTQAMQLFAISTGSFLRGALVMAFFAIGTAPALLGVGGLTSVIKGAFAKRFFTTVGLAVLAFGFFNINNGLTLTGVASAKVKSDKGQPMANIQDGVQVVSMTQKTNGYSPKSFTIVKDVPVKWVITSENEYSCAASIVMPKYRISTGLKKGENIIEFTPTEVGKIPFSCSMGMYRGSFEVVESLGAASDTSQKNVGAAPSVAAAPTSAHSCGSGGSGCGCGGSGPRKPTAGSKSQPATTDDSGVQTITAEDLNGSLEPSEFTVTAGSPVKWTIYSSSPPVGCMVAFVNRPLGFDVDQSYSGPTTIDFTATGKGDFDVTCPMGMWRATIHVQ